MNRRRLVVLLFFAAGAVLVLLGAYVRMPVAVAAGALLTLCGVGVAVWMLSRQMLWIVAEVRGAAGQQIDKLSIICAQLKAHEDRLFRQMGGWSEQTRKQSASGLSEAVAKLSIAAESRAAHLEAMIAESGITERLLLQRHIDSIFGEVITRSTELQDAIRRDTKVMLEDALTRQLAAHQSLSQVQEAIREEVAVGSNLALRTYRDITGEMREIGGSISKGFDNVLGSCDASAARADSALAELKYLAQEGFETAEREFGVLSKGLERADGQRDALRGLATSIAREYIPAIERRISESGESIDAKFQSVQVGVEKLAQEYEHDKQALRAFVTNEKELRKLSQMSMQWLKTETLREIEALSQLRLLLGTQLTTPLLGGWAMDAAAVYELTELIRARKPRRIVELGSGTSSIWVALALQSIGAGRLITFDHLSLYGEKTAAQLDRHDLTDYAEVRIVDLVPVSLPQGKFDWYDIGEGLGPIDMLIVDGPPGGTGPMARYPAIPSLGNQLAPGAIVIIDDANRPDERRMIKLWRDEFPELVEAESIGSRTKVLRLGDATGAATPVSAPD